MASTVHACKCRPFYPWYHSTDHARRILVDVGRLNTRDAVALQLSKVVSVDRNRARVEVLESFQGKPVEEIQFTPPDGVQCSLRLIEGQVVLLAIHARQAMSCLSRMPRFLHESILEEVRRLKNLPVESLMQQQQQRDEEMRRKRE